MTTVMTTVMMTVMTRTSKMTKVRMLTWRRELSSSWSVTEVLGERRPPLLERAQ